MAQPEFYQDAKLSAEKLAEFDTVKSQLDNAYAEWDELEAMKE